MPKFRDNLNENAHVFTRAYDRQGRTSVGVKIEYPGASERDRSEILRVVLDMNELRKLHRDIGRRIERYDQQKRGE